MVGKKTQTNNQNETVCFFIDCRDTACFLYSWTSTEVKVPNTWKNLCQVLLFLGLYSSMACIEELGLDFSFFLMVWHSSLQTLSLHNTMTIFLLSCHLHFLQFCHELYPQKGSYNFRMIKRHLIKWVGHFPWIFYVMVKLICIGRYSSWLTVILKHCAHSRFLLCHFQMIMCQNPPGSVLLT